MITDVSDSVLKQPLAAQEMANEKDYIKGVEAIAMAAYEAGKDRAASILFCMVNLLRVLESTDSEK